MSAEDRIAVLHRRWAHPDFEYTTTTCARKQESHPPPGDGWEPNVYGDDPHSAWERFEYHEEHHWRRRKEQIERPFTDPVDGSAVALLVAGREPSLWDGSVGVRHDGCGRLADVLPQLDAFYCHGCGRNGRVSGGWVIDVMAGRA